MNTSLQKTMASWKISYNPYIDLFQIYDRAVFALPNDKLKSKSIGSIKLVYSKSSHAPLLAEVQNAYEYLGDIDNMSKQAIIQSIVGYIEHHGKKI